MGVHPLIGKRAPEVTLLSATSEPYVLKPGTTCRPMAIFFYPASGTYGCTREACEFRDALAKKEIFKRTECDIVGISCDPPEKQKLFVDQNDLPYPVLSDTAEEASKLYSVSKGLLGLSKGRVTFFIDRDGTVLDVYESVLQFSQHTTFVEKQLAMLPEKAASGA
ncbi:hypothetical protein FRB94_008968 [Tulasnella sp. JGI-2019a]|nr:hypothetical protein FRB93_003501 [Tulasnella sp. JGI-2019a]KAG9014810.1 hypothetical protein FRB94_008968 [Tulasnella sp. JGI-2019a]KAG9040028.1 hypothetical protein FRB95_004500 [Tulasnella sp. JGI-2019a]